ncbi:MAG: hypothetical protein GX425_12280 [Peptococcaceae bacterium]|nr:hypothetical protein [Peptococcaceae bacterium]
MYEATQDKQYLEEFIGHADSVLARRDNIRGVTDYRGLRLPAWRCGAYTNYKKYYIYAVQTGLTAEPLAKFAAIVSKEPGLSAYQAKANEYLQAAKDAVAVHDMRNQPQYLDVQCNWSEDYDSMHLSLPLNMNLAQASAILAIYEATGDKSYLDKATKITNYFKKYLTVIPSSNSYTWKYFPGDATYGSAIEDLNHTTFYLDFIYSAYKYGLFNENDIQRFANTAEKVLIKNDGTIANRVDGSGSANIPGEIAFWLWFEQPSSHLFDVSYKILSGLTSANEWELVGVAMLNYTFARGNGQPVSDPGQSPEPAGNLIVNGDFSAGGTGWVSLNNSAKINTETNGNKYLTNGYNWDFYQELSLKPGTYKLNMRTKKGTANLGVRIPVQFFQQDGKYTVPYAFKYSNKGGDWESMPEMTIEVPSTAVKTRIYLSVDAGGSGTYNFDDVSLVPAGSTPAPEPDTIAPQAAITAPAGGSTLKSAANLEATASDNVGVTQLALAYASNAQGSWTSIGDSTLVNGTAMDGTWRLAWDISNLANGTYYVRATARDAAGNTSTSDPVAFVISNDQTNLIVNGDFSAGGTGWVSLNNSAKINTETNGNKYLTNGYNWDFYQELSLKPGTYKLNMRTKKGTANLGVRIPVQFFRQDGKYTVPYAFKYSNKGGDWESMPEMTIEVPSTAVKTRIYLSVDAGGSGTYNFDDIALTPVN